MKKKAIPRPKLELYDKARLFIDLGGFLYDFEDKDRYRKMNGLIDTFFSPLEPEKIQEEMKKMLPGYFGWNEHNTESFEMAKLMYLGPQSKTKRRDTIRFIKASVKLFYKLDEVLNRVDVIGIAFILRSSEYDIYLDLIVEDIGIPALSSVKKIKKFIIKNIVEGNCNDINSYGRWGRPLNQKYILNIQLKGLDETDEDYDYDDTHNWENRPPRRRGTARVRLIDRIDWGSEQIHKLLSEYKRNYAVFYN
jgi:hypothetical protein